MEKSEVDPASSSSDEEVSETASAGDPGAGAPVGEALPLYVDLDGTLVATDLLWESVLLLLRAEPAVLAWLPVWLLRGGRAHLKRQVAERAPLDPESLPYRPEVLALLEEARRQGRRIVLATASDAAVADAVARHLGLFDAVVGSDGTRNRKGAGKLAAIEADGGGSGFEYLGDAPADLPIWERSRLATLVAPSNAVARGVSRRNVPHRVLVDRPSRPGALWRALRPHQWVKNALLFVPLALAHQLDDLTRLADVAIAFASFCAVASGTYVLNDLLDLAADRQHPRKRLRPFASGRLPIPVGLGLVALLLAGGFGFSALLLPATCTGMLALYALLTTSYSLYLKEQLLIDVMLLAGLYTLRVLAGAIAARVPVSPWLLAFAVFFFLSLALVKRYTELHAASETQRRTLGRRAYEVRDLGLVENLGVTSGLVSVLVLCLFVTNPDLSRLYPNPEWLWSIPPVMLYWVMRVWFLARRERLPDDPVLFAATDPVSYAAGALIAVVVAVAAL